MSEESKEQTPKRKRAPRKRKTPEQRLKEQKSKIERELKEKEQILWEKLRADFQILQEQSEQKEQYRIVTLVRVSNQLKELSEIWLEESRIHLSEKSKN